MKLTFFLFLALSFLSMPILAQEEGKTGGQSSDDESATAKPKKKIRRFKKKKKRRCSSYQSPRYKKMKRRWQRVPKIPKPKYREGYRDLTLYAVNIGKRIRVFPYLPDGTLDPEVLLQIEELFQDKDSGETHPINPRLVKLIYKIADHFRARQVNIISGYRGNIEQSEEGNHGKGLAADINIPGVSLAGLARKARQSGFVGVGFYPASGFIHLDIREKRSYFWIDRSGPGKASCQKRMLVQAAAKFDRRYKPEKDEPKQHVNRKGIPLGAIPKPEPVPEPEPTQMGD